MNIHLGKTHPSQCALIVAVCKRRAVGFSQLFFAETQIFSTVVLTQSCIGRGKCLLPSASLQTSLWTNRHHVKLCHVTTPPTQPALSVLFHLVCCYPVFLGTWQSQKGPVGYADVQESCVEQPGGASWTKETTFWAPRLANNSALFGWLELANSLIYPLMKTNCSSWDDVGTGARTTQQGLPKPSKNLK